MADDEITLRFPGTAEYVRLARLAAADAGARAGLDVDDIDEIRVAVSELCALVGAGADGQTTLELKVAPLRLEVAGTGGPAPITADSEFADALITAVTDEYEFRRDDDTASFRFVKHAKGATGA